ncbi:MAG: type II toxin-antitoxin system PemK/MazF family toxin [Candidatus Lambdaproteobacteria bacterium]|nr:type II toxin-antitoxin system PemK/MazF family toxin [Candidatus Lambdaproteobacteria bacterium]
MARILRGDICWADLEPVRGREQAGRRPVLVLSREVFNDRSGTVIALAITSQHQHAGFPLTQPLPEGLLPESSWVKISQIRTLSTERLGRKLGRLPEVEVDRIVEGLLDIIGP